MNQTRINKTLKSSEIVNDLPVTSTWFYSSLTLIYGIKTVEFLYFFTSQSICTWVKKGTCFKMQVVLKIKQTKFTLMFVFNSLLQKLVGNNVKWEWFIEHKRRLELLGLDTLHVLWIHMYVCGVHILHTNHIPLTFSFLTHWH